MRIKVSLKVKNLGQLIHKTKWNMAEISLRQDLALIIQFYLFYKAIL